MEKFLILDIGAGTMDILFYDGGTNMHYKAVVKSPIRTVAEKAAMLSGHLLVTGVEMGGGPVTQVLTDRAKTADVVMSASAASTIHHDRERVRSLGIKVIEDSEAEELKKDTRYQNLTLGDLEPDRLEPLIRGLGVPFSFDAVGICAQDHGIPPANVSHLDFRHNIFKAVLDGNPFPEALLYRNDELPDTFNRLASMAKTAAMFHCEEIYLMDSGMAAVLGASMDPHAMNTERVIVLDIATSHTVCAALEHGEIAGFFEYHTKDITCDLLEALLFQLAEGQLEHERILREGGHGAYIRRAFGSESDDRIIATGPRRSLVSHSRLPMLFGAPLGDNMMTGTLGVLEAIRRRKGLDPLIGGE
ncbi:MAG: DUF1786 family protein [Desulfatiglandales bacterium]